DDLAVSVVLIGRHVGTLVPGVPGAVPVHAIRGVVCHGSAVIRVPGEVGEGHLPQRLDLDHSLAHRSALLGVGVVVQPGELFGHTADGDLVALVVGEVDAPGLSALLVDDAHVHHVGGGSLGGSLGRGDQHAGQEGGE